jgi:plasmid stability protein
MPTLHVRNVPESLYDRLRQRAQERNRSISAEVVTLLDLVLEESDFTQLELLDSIRRRRFFNPADSGAPDSTTLLREDRER